MTRHCGEGVLRVHPDNIQAEYVIAAARKGEPLRIAGVLYVPAGQPATYSYTDAEARAMRSALARLDRSEGRR